MQHEFNQRVRKRSFIVTTIAMPLLMVGLMLLPAVLAVSGSKSSAAKERIIAVEDNSGVIMEQLSDAGNLQFRMAEDGAEEVKKSLGKDIYGLLVIGEDVVSDPVVKLYTHETASSEVENRISSQIKRIVENIKIESSGVENIKQILSDINTRVTVSSFKVEDSGREKANVRGLSRTLSMIFGGLIYFIVFFYGSMVMMGVVDEKNSRVMEIIVSSVKPIQLMLGKILGIASVAILQFVIWIALIAILGIAAVHFLTPDLAAMLKSASSSAAAGITPRSLEALRTVTDLSYTGTIVGCFALFFTGGYLLYASMFAAIGSAVDNAGDLQQLQMPVTLPLVVAFMISFMAVNDPGSPLAVWCSIIPFTSPIVMMARIPFGVPAWQIGLSLVALYAGFAAMAWFAARIYRVGVFMYGKKPTIGEIIKWAGYKEFKQN